MPSAVPPSFCPFMLPEEPREHICEGEPLPDGHHAAPEHQDVDWIGPANQGGGHVPDDYESRSPPREGLERESMG